MRKVISTSIKEAKELIKLEYGNEVIYTTSEHPFYVNKNWIKASQLKVGDLLLLYDKTKLALQKITVIDTLAKVYNFTVENEHNYFVGNKKVLVHNDCDGITLTKGGTKKLGNLVHMKNLSIAAGVIARGGKIGNLSVISTDILEMKIGDIANLAAAGHEGAETAIKILKQASKKAQKY